MTHGELARRIAGQWTTGVNRMDWLGMEAVLVDVLQSNDPNMTADDRLALVREAIDAWTRRGHFSGSY